MARLEDVDPAVRPRLDEDVVWVEVDGEIVAVHTWHETVHLVSETGALLWRFLDGRATVEDLAGDVADVFGVESSRALHDVQRFVATMVANGLVLVGTGDGATGSG